MHFKQSDYDPYRSQSSSRSILLVEVFFSSSMNVIITRLSFDPLTCEMCDLLFNQSISYINKLTFFNICESFQFAAQMLHLTFDWIEIFKS